MTAEQKTTVQSFPESVEDLTALMRAVYKEEREADGKDILTLDAVKKALNALPRDETDRDLEKKIAKFADIWAPSVIKGDDAPITQLLPGDSDHLEYGSEEEWLAFTAFAVQVNYERLQKNPIQEDDLLKTYKKHFGRKRTDDPEKYEHPYFFHLDVLSRMDHVVSQNNNRVFLEKLLRDARQNAQNLVNNKGGHHAFAETTALVFENAVPALRKYFEESDENWLTAANESAIIALEIEYAKFYCTCGRVHALRGELDAAIYNVNKALALEDNTRKDYSLRISHYTSYYQQFRAQQMMLAQEASAVQKMSEITAHMKEQEEDITKRMELQEKETMAKNMEFLGLFSGIVSFTIGSLTLASNFKSEDAMKIAGLIVVLLGALICVFSAFGVILHGFFGTMRDRKTGKPKQGFIFRHIAVFILGALIVIGGIVFCIR